MKRLDIDNLSYVGSGAYGEYYRINGTKLGVKLSKDDEHRTVKEAKSKAKRSHMYREFENLKKLSSMTRLVPKAGEMVIVKTYNGYDNYYIYCVGYTMSHVEGKPVGDAYMTHADDAALERSRKVLKSKGIIQEDDHDYNVIKAKGRKRRRFVFVDSGSMRIDLRSKSRS